MNQKHEAATKKTRRFSFLSSSRFNFFTSCIIPPLLLLQRRIKYFSVLPNTLDGQDNPKFLRTQKPPASIWKKPGIQNWVTPHLVFFTSPLYSVRLGKMLDSLSALMFMSENFKHKSSNTVTQQDILYHTTFLAWQILWTSVLIFWLFFGDSVKPLASIFGLMFLWSVFLGWWNKC